MSRRTLRILSRCDCGRALGFGLILLACNTPNPAPEDPASTAALAGKVALARAAAKAAAKVDAEGKCAVSLAARAIACPANPGSPAAALEARALLLSADSPLAASDLINRLEATDLRGIARLAALDSPHVRPSKTAIDGALADPLSTPVSPIDDRVLALVVVAGERRLDRKATHTARIKANALLARTYNEALLQLGLPPKGPLPPLARVLAGRFLHYGRDFVSTQWRRRVPGLDDLAQAIERRLLQVLLAVEATPYVGDDALLTTERAACRRYLQGVAVGRRLSADGKPPPSDLLAPWTAEIDRWIDLGFTDQATDLALAYSRRVGIDPAESFLQNALQMRHRADGRRRAVQRFNEVREQDSPPPLEGEEPIPRRGPKPWPVAPAITGPIFDRLGSDTPRRQALVEAILTLRARPDAALYGLAELVPTSSHSTEIRRSDRVAEIDWLLPEVEARSPLTREHLRLAVAAAKMRTPPPGEASERSLRRNFALAAEITKSADDAKATEQILANRLHSLEFGDLGTSGSGGSSVNN
ncbi:MAG TPA: hypothetical protein ENJ18_05310 [Nannocystis exedens]|nr:hypothetical protein [Nannocystis exedens]